MPPVFDNNQSTRDSQQRLVSPRINLSLLPTAVSVAITATLLPANPRTDRTFIIVQNIGSVPIFIGDSSVTTSNGYQLNPFSDITIPCTDQAQIYAIASQSNNVCVL